MEKKSVFAKSSKEEKQKRKKIKSERVKGGDASSGDFLGPWAPYQGEEEYEKEYELTEEQKKTLEEIENRRKEEMEEKEEVDNFSFSSTFHGKEQFDYQGRSFIEPPHDLVLSSTLTNYIPKKCLKTYAGHTKGVLRSLFYPRYGHFLLTSSFDTTVRLWDVHGKRKCVMTYRGHKGAVKDM